MTTHQAIDALLPEAMLRHAWMQRLPEKRRRRLLARVVKCVADAGRLAEVGGGDRRPAAIAAEAMLRVTDDAPCVQAMAVVGVEQVRELARWAARGFAEVNGYAG